MPDYRCLQLDSTAVLLSDDSPDSIAAAKVLENAAVQFLTVKAPDAKGRNPPALLIRDKWIEGIEGIKEYVESTRQGQSLDRKLGLTLTALRRLGLGTNVDTFEQRLIIQKAVYLLQHFGLPVDWNYFWYIRGPYSTELARAMFGGRTALTQKELDQIAPKVTLAVGALTKYLSPASMTSEDLEAAATILFIGEKSFHARTSPAHLVNEVIRYKPKLAHPTVRKYVRILWPEILEIKRAK
jgi:hypothetical protein